MKLRYIRDVSELALDREKCRGCGMCIEVCPHAVFGMEDGKAFIFDKDACMECGACMRNCPFSAIEVSPGVGCAAAIIRGMLTGTEPSCGCSEGKTDCC